MVVLGVDPDRNRWIRRNQSGGEPPDAHPVRYPDNAGHRLAAAQADI